MTKEQAMLRAQELSAHYGEVYHVIVIDTLKNEYGVSTLADEFSSVEAYYNGEIYN